MNIITWSVLLIAIGILLIGIALKYDIKFDLVKSKKYTLLLWYNKYYSDKTIKRFYIKIFEV